MCRAARRLTAGLQLFDAAKGRMLAGIKMQFPGISDENARRIRRERLAWIRRWESIR